MGNCSLKAVADAANGNESIHIITPPDHHALKGRPKLIPSRLDVGSDQFENGFQIKRSEMSASRRLTGGKKSVEVLPTPRNGVWKVKLVVDPRDLEEILSEQVNAEALIQKMRMIAAINATPKRSGKGSAAGGGTLLPYMCSHKS